MMNTVKTVRLDNLGRQITEFHDGAAIGEVVARIEAEFPNSLIEARYSD